jgi:hypothetical protein
MKYICLMYLILSIIIQSGTGIDIPKEPSCQVTPSIGSMYSDKPVQGLDIYWNVYKIEIFPTRQTDPITLTLQVYNPEKKEWKEAMSQIYYPRNNTSISFRINLRDVFREPLLGISKYKLISNNSVLLNDSDGPDIKVNFRDEGFEPAAKDNLYNYFVWVRSTEQDLPVRLYVLNDGGKWIQYGKPQAYYSNIKKWIKLTWYNVPYYKKIEFIGDV